MNYWDSVGRWINTLLVFIVGVLAFDALFRLLEANEDNVIVAFVRGFAVIFLVPFQGMFGEQDYVLTTLVGVLGYALMAGIALGVLRSLQASKAEPAPPGHHEQPVAPVAAEPAQDVPRAIGDGASRTARPGPERAGDGRRPVEPAERSATRERPDPGPSNGLPRSLRPRQGADGGERTRAGRDGVGRQRRNRSRDRAEARRGAGPRPDADTGS